MPLFMINQGEIGIITQLHGAKETVKHIEDLGFIQDETVKIISKIAGNLIAEIKGSRLAMDKVMADHIIIKIQKGAAL